MNNPNALESAKYDRSASWPARKPSASRCHRRGPATEFASYAAASEPLLFAGLDQLQRPSLAASQYVPRRSPERSVCRRRRPSARSGTIYQPGLNVRTIGYCTESSPAVLAALRTVPGQTISKSSRIRQRRPSREGISNARSAGERVEVANRLTCCPGHFADLVREFLDSEPWSTVDLGLGARSRATFSCLVRLPNEKSYCRSKTVLAGNPGHDSSIIQRSQNTLSPDSRRVFRCCCYMIGCSYKRFTDWADSGRIVILLTRQAGLRRCAARALCSTSLRTSSWRYRRRLSLMSDAARQQS